MRDECDIPPAARDIWFGKLLYPVYRWPGTALAVSPVLVASGLAWRDGVFAALPASLALLLGWLMQLGGVLANADRNLRDDPDDAEHPDLVRAVAAGILRPAAIRRAALICLGLAAAASLALIHLAGIGAALFGAAGIAAAWAYSSGPLALGKAGMGDPLFLAMFGPVAVSGSYYIQAAASLGPPGPWQILPQALPAGAPLAGIAVGAFATTLLIVDDIRDRDHDRIKGKRTIPVRFGPQWSRVEFTALIALAYLVPLLWAGLTGGGWILLPLATLPLALPAIRIVLTQDSYRALASVKRRLAKAMLAFAAALALGLALG